MKHVINKKRQEEINKQNVEHLLKQAKKMKKPCPICNGTGKIKAKCAVCSGTGKAKD